jgi:release factor glutamine methyltransferase
VALAKELPSSVVLAVDVNEELLELAEENAQVNGMKERVKFQFSDLLDGLTEGDSFDAIVSNPPYVASDAINSLMPEVSRFEPREALDGGPDGMRYLRKLVQSASDRLKKGGTLLMEMAPPQVPWCAAEIRRTRAFLEPRVRQDLAGRDRVVEAKKA